MKKKIVLVLVTGILMLGMAGMAQATLIVYDNLNNFLANAGATMLYDFEADTAGYIKYQSYSADPGALHDFGDFTVDATGASIYSADIREQNDNHDIYMTSSGNEASLNVIFDSDITAFGFTYKAEGNNSWDHSTFSYDGITYDLGTPGSSGFFGLIEDSGTFAAGTPFSFGQQSSNWSTVSFDNIIYSSSNPSPVPEPTSVLLFSIGLTGLAGIGIGRRKKR